MDTGSWEKFFVSLFGTPKLIVDYLTSFTWLALALATLTPILLLYARHEILLKRLRAILDFMLSFKMYNGNNGKTGTYNPSFEFVKSKYISDIKLTTAQQQQIDAKRDEADRLKLYIEFAGKFGSRSSGRMYVASIGFMIVCYYGFKAIFGAFSCNFAAISACVPGVGSINQQMLVIGSLAFVGAFVAAVRMLLRSLALFDLSAFSFLRHSAEIIFSVLLVMLVYRAFPDPFFNVGKLMMPDSIVGQLNRIEAQQRQLEAEDKVIEQRPADTTAADPANPATDVSGVRQPATATASDTGQPQSTTVTEKQPTAAGADQQQTPRILPSVMGPMDSGIPWLWFALAPVLGLLPASSTKFLLIKLQSLISWIKTTDDRFVSVSRIVSLDIIDGIDFETRFRLEECGIYDVQNLATYNPVMLHIETPYGIYQTIDWVAQAQLCHIVGQERFMMFREVNVRTIFDLERAIDSKFSPEVFDDIYASILFAPTENLKKAAGISQFKFLITDTNGFPRQVSVEEYCTWARQQIRTAPTAKPEQAAEGAGPVHFVEPADAALTQAVEHLMVWISDDLHIRRLRRLWLDISDSLGEQADCFPDSKRMKVRQDYIDAMCTAWVENKEVEKAKAADAEKQEPEPGNEDQEPADAPIVDVAPAEDAGEAEADAIHDELVIEEQKDVAKDEFAKERERVAPVEAADQPAVATEGEEQDGVVGDPPKPQA